MEAKKNGENLLGDDARFHKDTVTPSFDEMMASIMPSLKSYAAKILYDWPSVARHWEPDDLVNHTCIRLIKLDHTSRATEGDLLRVSVTIMKNIVRDKKKSMTAKKRGKYKEISLAHVNTDC